MDICCGYSWGASNEYPQHMFLWRNKNICCGYSLEAPHGGASNEYPQHMFLWRNKNDISIFRLKRAPYLFLWIMCVFQPMSIHNICYHGEIRKNINNFLLEKWIIWSGANTILPGALRALGKVCFPTKRCTDILISKQKHIWCKNNMMFWILYHIQPNYRTVHLGFSKILGKLAVKYVPTCTLYLY